MELRAMANRGKVGREGGLKKGRDEKKEE